MSLFVFFVSDLTIRYYFETSRLVYNGCSRSCNSQRGIICPSHPIRVTHVYNAVVGQLLAPSLIFWYHSGAGDTTWVGGCIVGETNGGSLVAERIRPLPPVSFQVSRESYTNKAWDTSSIVITNIGWYYMSRNFQLSVSNTCVTLTWIRIDPPYPLQTSRDKQTQIICNVKGKRQKTYMLRKWKICTKY